MDDNTSAASIYNRYTWDDGPPASWDRLAGIAEVFLDSGVDTVWIAHYSDLVTVTLADMDEWSRLRKLRRCVVRIAPGRRCEKLGAVGPWVRAPYCEEHAPPRAPYQPHMAETRRDTPADPADRTRGLDSIGDAPWARHEESRRLADRLTCFLARA